MEPRPTAVQPPIQIRIADDIRMQIERGDLAPGDALPTLAELAERWSCSVGSARAAVALLKAQGLITSGRGKAPAVRVPPKKVVRSSERHQAEKDLAILSKRDRGAVGEAETNHKVEIGQQQFTSRYDQVTAGDNLAGLFGIDPTDRVLRRQYVSTDPGSGLLLSSSVSYIPVALVETNPDLLDESKEPWPGGTQHQLSTVGIEIMTMVDEVTARMPSTPEAQSWGLADGVPLVLCRRISYDAAGRVVEVSDAEYPADRTELRFVTPLKPWPARRKRR